MSLLELENALPTLSPQASPPREIDWTKIEEALETPLPRDFKNLSERYRFLLLDAFLSVHIPAPGAEDTYCESVWDLISALDHLTGGGAEHPNGPYRAGRAGGLIPWASSPEGDYWYWRVTGADPDRWPVVVGNRQADWEEWAEVEATATSYLAGLVRGEIPGHGLPEGFPGRAPSVHANTWPAH
ncbi:hypothetical protein ACWEJQ_22150 [Streptomyces albidoflavus]